MAITYAFNADRSPRVVAMANQDFDPDIKRCVSDLLSAANNLAYAQNRELDIDLANYLYFKIGEIRDLAEELLPTVEDWGGANIVPFVPKQRA